VKAGRKILRLAPVFWTPHLSGFYSASLNQGFYWELCGKAIKPLFFKAPLAAPVQHIFTLIPLLRDCAVIRRVAVFLQRRGRKGFARDAEASRPLRKVAGGCGSSPQDPQPRALRKGREALAPFAKPLRPLRYKNTATR
jgi:hypothetical protein